MRGDRELAAAAALAGAAGLAYETLWTRLLGLALGHEQLGVLSVLAGFFAGMAVGAAASHRVAEGLRRPLRVFAGLQGLAAAYALLAPYILLALGRSLPAMLGVAPAPGRSLLAAALILLPATAALGASLPILVAARRRLSVEDDARGLARLYGFDTLGATAGVLLTIHVVLPRLGFPLGSLVAAALGLSAAGLALLVTVPEAETEAEARAAVASEVDTAPGSDDPDDGLLRERWLLYLAIALTGLLGLGLEVVAVRVLAQLFSGTIYSFADLLAVWLLGTALGTGLIARARRRPGGWLHRRPATTLVLLLLTQALVVAASAWVARLAPAMLGAWAPTPASWGRLQLAEVVVAALVLGPATVIMGACFAHLLALIAAPAAGETHAPRAIGLALAINALAAAAAPFVFGLLLLERLDYLEVWALIAWAYLLLALAVAWLRRFPPRLLAPAALAGAGAIVLLTAGAGSLVLFEDDGQGEGWTILEQREGPLGVVSVSELTAGPSPSGAPLRRLRVDRHFRMGGAMSIGERRMGHLPLLLGLDHDGAAQSVLFLGLGTGATAGAGLGPYPISQVTAVELVPDVIAMLPYFEGVNGGLGSDPRARVLAADARRMLLADREQHRVIVADLFHPARDGAGSLYAREHFAAARARLTSDGVFVQWLPLYQIDRPSLLLILRTFLGEFPEAHAFLALYNVETPALGLFGAAAPMQIDLAGLRRVLEDPAHAELYQSLALTDVRDLFGGYLLDRPALLELAGEGPIDDDLHPRLDLWAPKAALGPATGVENLELLLDRRVPWPDALLRASAPERAWLRAGSAAFAEALGHYLGAEAAWLRERLAGASSPSRAVLQRYLAAYEREPEFLPARPRLYAAAAADPQAAEWLLPAMLARTPDQPRVHRAWLRHLARVGDQARFDAALAGAQERFAGQFDPQ